MADGSFSIPARTATPGDIERAIRPLAAGLDFELDIPGQHSGGLSNQELFDILAHQGRDFGALNATIKRHVATSLRLALDGARHLPSERELRDLVRAAVLEWVLARMDYKVRDVRIKSLTNEYQKLKRKQGFDGPVGVRTGDLRDAVKKARVILH